MLRVRHCVAHYPVSDVFGTTLWVGAIKSGAIKQWRNGQAVKDAGDVNREIISPRNLHIAYTDKFVACPSVYT